MNVARTSWRSLHIFLHDGERFERFLTEVIGAQVAAADGLSWFFIRYWVGGPHLRLRLASDNANRIAVVRAGLAHAILDYAATAFLDREIYYSSARFEGYDVDPRSQPWYADGEIVDIAYEPEIMRYGGHDALAVNERLFCVSSDLALRIVKATSGNHGKRLALGASLMVALSATGRSTQEARLFLAAYVRLWAGMFGEGGIGGASTGDPARLQAIARTTLNHISSETGRTPAAAWSRTLKTAIGRFRDIARTERLISPRSGALCRTEDETAAAIDSMLMSQLHMLNNRLGISIAEECALASGLVDAMATGAGLGRPETLGDGHTDRPYRGQQAADQGDESRPGDAVEDQ